MMRSVCLSYSCCSMAITVGSAESIIRKTVTGAKGCSSW
ncbi:Uncharacterised protein [Mycobacteroides abscessus subsp. abscessus]|nr:Uncharacterised protein [Mycobacteroides abscessus subsp. abscessus]